MRGFGDIVFLRCLFGDVVSQVEPLSSQLPLTKLSLRMLWCRLSNKAKNIIQISEASNSLTTMTLTYDFLVHRITTACYLSLYSLNSLTTQAKASMRSLIHDGDQNMSGCIADWARLPRSQFPINTSFKNAVWFWLSWEPIYLKCGRYILLCKEKILEENLAFWGINMDYPYRPYGSASSRTVTQTARNDAYGGKHQPVTSPYPDQSGIYTPQIFPLTLLNSPSSHARPGLPYDPARQGMAFHDPSRRGGL